MKISKCEDFGVDVNLTDLQYSLIFPCYKSNGSIKIETPAHQGFGLTILRNKHLVMRNGMCIFNLDNFHVKAVYLKILKKYNLENGNAFHFY